MTIILIGRCCRITLDIQKLTNLKEKTSLFEWVWTDTLTEINYIIEKLINNEPITIIRKDSNDYFENTNIKTSHYVDTDYKSIVDRRSQRFINDIINNKKLLFIRDDVIGTIKYDEIHQFSLLIKRINPELNFKILLLSEKNNYSEIIYDNLYHKIYDPTLYNEYINLFFSTREK